MSTTLKEWLKHTIAELEEERDATPGAVNEDAANALSAMKLALASLMAEPVAEIHISRGGYDKGEKVIDYFPEEIQRLNDGQKLYTAPPAPVSVPDGYRLQPISEYDAMCAAMLQGADDTLTNEDTKRVGELVMWVKRLAHSLRKTNPDSKLQSDAMDYLSRKGLIGVEDILR